MQAKTGFTGFDPKNVSEDVLKMVKYSFDTTLDSLTKIQELNDRIIKGMIQTNKQIHTDAEKMVGEFTENGKKGWDEYRKVVEKGFKQVEEMIQPTK